MHIGIDDMGTSTGRRRERIVVIGSCFEDEPLIAWTVLGPEDGVVDLVIVAHLIPCDIVYTSLWIRPRVIAMFVEVAPCFISLLAILSEILDVSFRADLSAVHEGQQVRTGNGKNWNHMAFIDEIGIGLHERG